MSERPGRQDWSATQYLRFEDERTRPAADLLAHVACVSPERVVDVGCGPGNSTELLVRRWPDAQVVGFDTSPDMLASARQRLPGVEFHLADAVAWTPASPPDVIFANAVFQWVPDHLSVLARLIGLLAPGGVLAVQMPDNVREPSHVAMQEAADAMPFAAKLRQAAREPLPPIGAYHDRLAAPGVALDIWRTTYVHHMADADAIVEWVKGTGLRPFLDPLDPDEQAQFVADYRRRLAEAYRPQADGSVLLPFPRLFLVATRRP